MKTLRSDVIFFSLLWLRETSKRLERIGFVPMELDNASLASLKWRSYVLVSECWINIGEVEENLCLRSPH